MEPAALPTREAAEYLGLGTQTLCNDRVTRALGIPYVRIGRRICYLRKDLDAFLEARRVDPGNGAAA